VCPPKFQEDMMPMRGITNQSESNSEHTKFEIEEFKEVKHAPTGTFRRRARNSSSIWTRVFAFLRSLAKSPENPRGRNDWPDYTIGAI